MAMKFMGINAGIKKYKYYLFTKGAGGPAV